jgi:hypothetical protein
MVPIEAELPMRQFLLIEYPADCPFCAAAGIDPSRVVEVQASAGVDWLDEQVTVSCQLEVVRNDLDGLVYRLLRILRFSYKDQTRDLALTLDHIYRNRGWRYI